MRSLRQLILTLRHPDWLLVKSLFLVFSTQLALLEFLPCGKGTLERVIPVTLIR